MQPSVPGEDEAAARRRLGQEMGVDCALVPLFVTQYRANVSDGLIEDEVVHVFGGRYDGPAKPNAAEVSDWKWITFDELESDLRARPENYAVWFRHYLTGHGETIAKWIGR